jgi:hypothetical protein
VSGSTAIHTAALAAWDAGLNVVPVKNDGSKAPEGEWKHLMDMRFPRVVVDGLYRNRPHLGLGLITGATFQADSMSGRGVMSLEMLECEDWATYENLKKAAQDSEVGSVLERIESGYMERTPKGGVHLLYYCSVVGGNRKLAEFLDAAGTRKPLIETRGNGGYVIVAPSGGTVHPTGNPYVLKHGGFSSIATLTPDEREALFDLAHTLDQLPKRERATSSGARKSGRVGDAFNAEASWDEDVLGPHGWVLHSQAADITYWQRPGAETDGKDASTNAVGTDRLKVFSTSAHPFDTDRSYSKFEAYALLNHGGDFAAAAADLRTKGYGEATAQATRRFDILTYADFQNRPIPAYRIHKLIRDGGFGALVGDFGSYKSFIALGMALSVALGRSWCGCDVVQGPVVYIAAEGGGAFKKRVDAFRRFHQVDQVCDFYILPDSPQLSNDGDLAALLKAVEALPDVPVLVILDTLARTFTGNENAQEDMNRYVAAAGKIQALGPAVLLLHHNRRDGGYRGSSALPGALDTMIAVKKSATGVVLSCEKQKDDEPFDDIVLKRHVVPLGDVVEGDVIDLDVPSSLVFTRDETATHDKRSDGYLTESQRTALTALADNPEGALTTTAWLRESELVESTFFAARKVLLRERLVDLVKPGKRAFYQVSDRGRRVLAAGFRMGATDES